MSKARDGKYYHRKEMMEIIEDDMAEQPLLWKANVCWRRIRQWAEFFGIRRNRVEEYVELIKTNRRTEVMFRTSAPLGEAT